MNLNLISLIAFVMLFILLLVVFVAFVYLTGSLNKRKYLKDIKSTFQRLGYTIIKIEKATGVEETAQEDPSIAFVISYGGSATHTFYKNVVYLNKFNQQKNCTVAIKKFLFIIVSIKYKFEH
ncbi:hypothetical protein A0256_23690 [Mucilaginibacter sp. PAMC 26640]|nr:hypothetical protein A0256_23690 [Mucilaginibacter sp. PAMC 26640]